MAIKKEYSGNPSHMPPGEHKVTISELKMGKSKSDKPMLTISFKNDDEQIVKGYYVLGLNFVAKQLEAIKLACGLSANADGMLLNGKRLGISVEQGEPDANGKSFARIVGYGKESDVEASPATPESAPPHNDSEIPF